MKNALVVLLIVVAVLTSCASTKTAEPVVEAQVPAAQPMKTQEGFFMVDGNLVMGGVAAVEVGDYLYAAGKGDLGYQVTSTNQAKANILQLISEYTETKVKSVMENYAQGGGIANNSSDKEFQSVVNNMVATLAISSAQIKGIEYVDAQITDTEAVYLLARVKLEKLNELVKEQANTVLRSNSAVIADTNAKNTFQSIRENGIF